MAEAMSTARDWALILLALQGLVLSLLPLFLSFKAVQGLRSVKPKARPFLRHVRAVGNTGLRAIDQVGTVVARPFVGLKAAVEGWRAFWGAYRRRAH